MKRSVFKNLISEITTADGDKPLRVSTNGYLNKLEVSDVKGTYMLASVSETSVGSFEIYGDESMIFPREGLDKHALLSVNSILSDYALTELKDRDDEVDLPYDEESERINKLEEENDELKEINKKLVQELKELRIQQAKIKNILE